MNYNKEEVEKHLNVITKYIDFITNLEQKYHAEKTKIRKKLVLRDLIYYSDGTFKSLCRVFNFIINNFKNTKNLFLLDYRCLRYCKMLSIDKICKNSLVRIDRIIEIKNILETIINK
jgi:uncharacterized protein YuzB (UPF0349 family)